MSDERQDPLAGRGSYASRRGKKKKAKRDPEAKAATYRIGESTIERIDNAAKFYHVQKGDFVRFLLNYALDQLENEAIELPTVDPNTPKKIDW